MFRSVLTKIRAVFGILICVIVLLIIGVNVYTYIGIRQNEADTRRSLLQIIAGRIDKDLTAETAALNELTAAYLADGIDIFSQDELKSYLSSIRFLSLIQQKIMNAAAADCYFVSSPDLSSRPPGTGIHLVRFSPGAREIYELEQFIKFPPDYANAALSDEWQVFEIGGVSYLFKVYKLSLTRPPARDVRIGAVVRLGRIAETPEGAELYYEYPGNALPGFEPQSRRVYERVSLSHTPLTLVGAWETRAFVLPAPLAVITSLGLLALITIAASVLYISRSFKLTEYKEQIEKQKDELRYLGMQIRPHFYLNAISTISSMLYLERSDDIQAYIAALSEYLRYLLADYPRAGGRGTLSTVAEEVKHAADFIKLQQIRYPGNITCIAEVAPEVSDVPMPRLVVQTFSENVFKHAFRYGRPLIVRISAEAAEGFVRIRVDDNGDGLPEDIISGGKHSGTGIANVRRMLELQYGQKDLLKLSGSSGPGNLPQGGTRAEILIPREVRDD
ncbi:MAG: histidine kinase [Clostridiales bacterium]|jgi:hypothetical protein|nr:histidine kinase [Clostridiales bacterium]